MSKNKQYSDGEIIKQLGKLLKLQEEANRLRKLETEACQHKIAVVEKEEEETDNLKEMAKTNFPSGTATRYIELDNDVYKITIDEDFAVGIEIEKIDVYK